MILKKILFQSIYDIVHLIYYLKKFSKINHNKFENNDKKEIKLKDIKL